MSENTKRFKEFRNELNESEYKETLTGYPNRGIDTDVGPVNKDLLPKVNAVLTAMNRYTYQHTSEALIKIRTRLNLFMLDFPWTPWMWQNNTLGSFAVPVTLFGRVDGVDGVGGGIRFDGKANPNAGLQEFTLSVSVETAEDGLYRVIAKLQPREEAVLPEGVEEDGDAVTEDYQTDARAREMANKIEKHEEKAQSGYAAKMTQSGKAAARGRRQEAKHDAASRRLMKRDQKEQDSPRTYGRGGKLVKRGSRAEVKEENAVSEEWKSLKKTKADLDAIRASGKKVSVQHGEGDTLYRVSKAKKSVKEEAEQIEEMHKPGDTVKVPHKGKMVKGKIVRHDSGGSGKAAQHGGGYVVDVGEYSSITVPSHKVVKEETKKPWWEGKTRAELDAAAASASAARKGEEEEKRKRHAAHNKGKRFFNGTKWVKEEAEQIDELSKKTLDSYISKRGSQLQRMTTGLDRYRNLLTGKQQANAVKGIKRAMGVKEELVGGQKKLDVNKNKKLDAQDFAMLRAKKKPMKEELVGGQARLDMNKNKRLDSQDFKMLRAKKKPVAEAKMKTWTPRLDKLLGSSRDAVRSKPKKSKILRKIKDGKVVSTKVIPAYTPKKDVKEYTEMMPGISLQIPAPTEARADKSGKGKRFHKGAMKSVEEAVAKGKKKKPSAHTGAANVIARQKSIKSTLQKHDMRW